MLRLRLRSARRRSLRPAAARSGLGRGEHGPGAAIGVAMMFPMLTTVIGGLSIPALDAERLLVGAATIDPFRSRTGT